MKKTKIKKAALCIAAVMTIASAAGCTKEKEAAPENAAVLAYKGTSNVMDGMIKGSVVSFAYNGGKVYAVSQEYPDNEEDSVKLWISSFDTDGGNFCSESFECNSSVTQIAFDSSGTPCIALGEYGANGTEKITLKKIGADCRFTEEQDISGIVPMLENGGNYLSRIGFDSDGNIYTLFGGGIGMSDSGGEPVFAAECENGYSMYFVKDSGGGLYIAETNYDGAFDLYTVNAEQKQLEKINSLSVNEGWYSTNILTAGCGDIDLYWCDKDFIYSYDIETNTAEKIFSLSDAGIPSTSAEYIFTDGKGGFVFAGTDLRSNAPVITSVSQRELTAAENNRKEITAAGLFYDITADIDYRAAEFNRTSADLKVSLTKFSSPDEFSADMLAGQLKDIIFSGSSTDINTDSLISKGVYADLNGFIDNDSELSREDFLPNIINAFERDGKLYTFTDSFMIQTALGKKSIIGDIKSITFDDIDRIADSLPAGTELFPGNDKNNLLRYLMSISGYRFVDKDTKSCSFDSDEFVKLLKFADKYGLPAVDENYYSHFSLAETFVEDHGVMLITYLADFRDIYYYEHNMFMEDISAAGVPCESGTGEAIVAETIFGINASSGNAEDCWKFIRTLLLPEYQNYTDSFPVRKDSFEKRREETVSKKPDENEDYYLICFVGDMAYGIGSGEPFTIEKSDADKIADAVYAAEVPYFLDSSIDEIITEEASSFFSGAKSAETAADMIQNRVSVYLSE